MTSGQVSDQGLVRESALSTVKVARLTIAFANARAVRARIGRTIIWRMASGPIQTAVQAPILFNTAMWRVGLGVRGARKTGSSRL